MSFKKNESFLEDELPDLENNKMYFCPQNGSFTCPIYISVEKATSERLLINYNGLKIEFLQGGENAVIGCSE